MTSSHQEMQAKTMMRYHLVYIRMASIKNRKQQVQVNRWRSWTFVHRRWECKMVQALWKTAWLFLKKINTELPHSPAVLLLGRCTPKFENKDSNSYSNANIQRSIFKLAKSWKQPKCLSTEEWITKHIQTMKYYSAIKIIKF